MRIALIVPGGVGRDGVHGVIPALLALIERLARDHELLVIALEQEPQPCRYPLRGAQVVCLGMGRNEKRKTQNATVGPQRLFGGARIARMLAVLRPFRPDVIHAFWFGGTSTLALLAGRALGTPVVASLGGGELVRLPAIGYGGRLHWRGRLHNALAIRLAQALTAGSCYALAPLRERRPDARWMPLGVEQHQGSWATDRRTPARLITVASINRVKGPDVLLQALAQTPDAELTWVGADTLDGAIQRHAAELKLQERIHFVGFQPHPLALEQVAHAGLYLQSSWHESQGVAVLEAAAAGVPTVGTAVGLVAELAPTAAVAVPPGDPHALAEAINALLANELQRQELGRAAQAWAQTYDADWTAQQCRELYQTIR